MHSDLVIEVLLRMLDWMGVCKTTWSSAEGVWDMLRSMVPDPNDYPVFSHVKRKLEEYMAAWTSGDCTHLCQQLHGVLQLHFLGVHGARVADWG